MSVSGISSNTNRITGLATGMDTDAMIKNMMTAEQNKIDKANQDKQTLEWKQEAYVDIIKDLKSLQDTYLDIAGSKDTSLVRSSAYTGSKATSGNEDILTASTYPGAINGTYQVKVEQMAEAAKKQSDFSLRSAVSGTITPADWNTASIKVTIGTQSQETIDLTGSYDNVTQIVDKINSEININHPNLKDKISAVEEDGKIRIVSLVADDVTIESAPDSALNTTIENVTTDTKLSDLGVDDSQLKITVEGKEFSIDTSSDMTVNDFMNAIRNKEITVGGSQVALSNYITVGYSELTQKLTIQTRSTGSAEKLKIEGVSGNIVDKLGISTAGEVVGQDAKVSIKSPEEDVATTVTRSSNNFTIDNITYNLKEAQADTEEPINIIVKPDATESVEKFKKFIDAYNELVDKINTKLTEKKDYNYKPLTDAQKEEMETEDIKAWETKAKQGLLKGDMQLQSILNNMREAFYSKVEGAGISITEIGISTKKYGKDGKLEIDEDKLKEALETKGDQVQKLFTQSSNNEDEQGIFIKIKNMLNGYIGSDGSLIKKAGYEDTRWMGSNDITKSIQAKNKLIKELQDKFYTKQERYYQNFAKLESAMNQLNSQSNWLYSQLGMA